MEALLELCQTFEAVNENFNGRDFVFLPKQHRSEVYWRRPHPYDAALPAGIHYGHRPGDCGN